VDPRRTEALSDSTFAVAMTLLIFDVRLPIARIHTLGYDLWFNESSHYAGYVLSFLVIGMIWISHHTIFRLLRGIDHSAMLINLGLLAVVVFIPFPTQVLALYLQRGSHQQAALAAAFYGVTLAVATLMLALLWHNASRGRRLIAPWVHDNDLKRMTRRYYLSPLLYLAATGLALIDARIGMAVFVVIGSVYLLHTGTRVAPRHPHEALNFGSHYVDPLETGSEVTDPGANPHGLRSP
jgi:uncharacterized membrane protein